MTVSVEHYSPTVARQWVDWLVDDINSEIMEQDVSEAEQAIDYLTHNRPDVIFMDHLMPGMDGYEVCRRLREMPGTADVPIMFLSSLEEVQNKTRGFEAGANDYLTKPLRREEFSRLLERWLGRAAPTPRP
mgnify:CR=1 FL=1